MHRMNWPDDRLCRMLEIEIPIIQAPMAGSSTLAMAEAVRQGGGLGSLAWATLDVSGLRAHIEAMVAGKGAGAPRSFNVNFFAHPPPVRDGRRESQWLRRLSAYYEGAGIRVPDRLGPSPLPTFDEASCAVIESLRPKVVSFHFGLPSDPLIARIKGAGAILMSSATTVQEARWLEDHGCDVIIAQGAEAGGHRGMFLTADVHTQLGTMALVPQVVDAVDAPVVAAGGIADGRAIAAAFALGASAVQMGTAFLFTSEANVSQQHRAALRDAANSETAITNVFSGHPARCVMNRVMREVGPMAEDAPSFPLGFSAMGPLRREGEASSHRDFGAHYAGQAAPLGACNDPSALDVVRALAEEANGSFRRMVR